MKLPVAPTKKEQLIGFAYLAFQLFFLPSLLLLISDNLPVPLNEAIQNFLFFVVNFVCVVLIFHCFLLKNFQLAKSQVFRVLRYAFLGFLLYHGSMFVVNALILSLRPEFVNINNEAIAVIVEQAPMLMGIGTVFLAPVVEETLYRGLLFASLHQFSRLWAYIVSTVLFAAIHVLGYLWYYNPITLLLCFVQYIPAGIALGWAYEKSGTIWCSVLIHMTVNQTAMLLLR